MWFCVWLCDSDSGQDSVCDIIQSSEGPAQVGFALMSITLLIFRSTLLQGRATAGWNPQPAVNLPKLLLCWCLVMGWDGVGGWRGRGRSGQGRALKLLWEQSKLRTWPSSACKHWNLIQTHSESWLYIKNAFNLQTILIAKLVYCFTLKYETTLLFLTFWQYKTIKFLLLIGWFCSCLSISTNHVEVDKTLCLFYKPFNTETY